MAIGARRESRFNPVDVLAMPASVHYHFMLSTGVFSCNLSSCRLVCWGKPNIAVAAHGACAPPQVYSVVHRRPLFGVLPRRQRT